MCATKNNLLVRVINRCFLWQTNEHTHLVKLAIYLFKMRCVCILTVTFRQDVSYNKKPEQTTALGKHTTSKLGNVVCLP